MKFDCGNRTEDCDNATICPCMNFIEQTKKSYENVIKSDIFKNATSELLCDNPNCSRHKECEAFQKNGWHSQFNCERYKNQKSDLQMNINTCYRNLGYIEDFLEEYDEVYGLGAIKNCPDYDEAIAALRNTLHGIIKEMR